MNRKNLQQLAQIRLLEAKQLHRSKNPSGAYYLGGYCIELALKACIAKKTRRHDFPELSVVSGSYTHDLKKLIKLAGLEKNLENRIHADSTFAANWAVIKDWDPDSRYKIYVESEAKDLISSVTHTNSGILKWIKLYW